MNGPQPGQRNQLIGMGILAVGVLILILGAIAQSTGITSVGWVAIAVGVVLYILSRYGSSRSPRDDSPAVGDSPSNVRTVTDPPNPSENIEPGDMPDKH